MVGSQKRRISSRKSTRLEKKRRKVLMHDLPDTNLGSKIHSALGSKEDLVVVTQEKESIASLSWIPDPDERSKRSPIVDFVEEVLFRLDKEESSSDNMLASTRLKYNRFRGDGK